MKTKEELNEIKEEIERLDKKLHELTEEELEQVTGGDNCPVSDVVHPIVVGAKQINPLSNPTK